MSSNIQTIPCHPCCKGPKPGIENPTNAVLIKSGYVTEKGFKGRPSLLSWVTTYSCGLGYEDCSMLNVYIKMEDFKTEVRTPEIY